MKTKCRNLGLVIALLWLFTNPVFSQQMENTYKPVYYSPVSHDASFDKIPEKSFYKSKDNWQYIIDTTWGPGLPYADKLEIFDDYTQALTDEFDGFQTLQINWDSLKNEYRSKIIDTTSRGAFSALMTHLTMQLHCTKTYAFDDSVVYTSLNPGIPVLVIGAYFIEGLPGFEAEGISHFGSVLTCLADSSLLVLRTIENHLHYPTDINQNFRNYIAQHVQLYKRFH